MAVHIADAMARLGKRTLLVDADPQGSALDWAAARDESHDPSLGDVLFPVIGLPTKALQTEIPVVAKNYDCVVIDGPPRIDGVTASAIAASDLVLIPVQPSPYDVWACGDIIELVERGQGMNYNVAAVFAINRKISGTVIGNEVHQALDEFPLEVLATQVCQRVSFADTATKGKTVLQTAPNDIAAKEISSLVNDILERFNGQGRLISSQTA